MSIYIILLSLFLVGMATFLYHWRDQILKYFNDSKDHHSKKIIPIEMRGGEPEFFEL